MLLLVGCILTKKCPLQKIPWKSHMFSPVFTTLAGIVSNGIFLGRGCRSQTLKNRMGFAKKFLWAFPIFATPMGTMPTESNGDGNTEHWVSGQTLNRSMFWLSVTYFNRNISINVSRLSYYRSAVIYLDIHFVRLRSRRTRMKVPNVIYHQYDT